MGRGNSSIYVTILGNAKPFSRSLLRAQKSLGTFGKSVSSASGMAGGAVAGLGVAAGLATVAVGKAFLDFDDQMTKSTAIMGDVSADMRADMEKTARSVAKSSTFGAGEAAEAYFFLASAGLDARQSIAALPRVTKFAQAGAFGLARATDLLTDAQSALGLTVDDTTENIENMNRVSDVLVKANTLANASVEQFSEALTTKAGAALKTVGKDIEEGVAVLAAFADQGIKGSEAGTALGIVMRDLQTKAIKNKAAWQEMNVAAFDASGEMLNMGTIIGGLEQSLEGMSDEQQKATLLQLGFSDKSVSFIQALLGQSEAIADYETALRSAGGATEDVANKQLTSFKNQISVNVIAPLQDAAISVGKVFIPSLVRIGSAIGNIAPYLVDFATGLEIVIGYVSDIPDVVKIAVLAIGGLKLAITAISANPVVAGLTLVAGLVTTIGMNARDAEERATDLAEALLEMGDQALFKAVADAANGSDRLSESMAKLGVDVEDVANAIKGGRDGWLTWIDSLDRGDRSITAQAGLIGFLNTELIDLRTAYFKATDAIAADRRETELATISDELREKRILANRDALAELVDATGDATGAAHEQTEAMWDLERATSAEEQALIDLANEQRRAADPLFALRDAQQRYKEQLDTLNTLQQEGKEGTQEYTDAQLALIDAQGELNEANMRLGAVSDVAVEAFAKTALQAGMSRDQVAELVEMILGYNALDIDSKDFNFSVSGQVPSKIITTEAGKELPLFHSGGQPGALNNDEIVAKLKKGEVVRTPDQEAALAGNLAAAQAGGPVNVYVMLNDDVLARAVLPALTEDVRIHVGSGR